MTGPISLTYQDAMLVFCMPRAGGQPADMLHGIHFQDRSAIPNYGDFVASLTRLERAGVIEKVNNLVCITIKWKKEIAAIETAIPDFTNAAIRFAEKLESLRFEEVCAGGRVGVSRVEYDRTRAKIVR